MKTRMNRYNVGVVILMLGLTTVANGQSFGTLEEAIQNHNLLSNGGFEVDRPSYFTPSGAGAMWTTEEKRTPGYSVKLMGAGSASWTDENAVRNWLSGVPGYLNPEIVVGGWVKAVGVNTNPTTVDQKFQLVYQFFGADGTDLLGEPVVIDVPQGAANSDGWVEISSASLGAIALPSSGAAKRVKITFRKGANATGSVFLDDIFIRKANPAAEGWAGDWFNANFDVPQGWYYWMPGSATAGFSEGGADFTTTWKFRLTATTEDKATGARSLVIQDQLSEPSTEAPLISERVPVVAGQPVLVSFRAKHSGVTDPEALGTGDVNYGLTALFYNNMTGGADGYGEIGGADIRLNGDYNPMVIPLVSRVATSGWTHYSFIVYPKEGAIGMELRMRYWHSLTGSLFLDDIAIVSVADITEELEVLNLLSNGGFEVDRPSYFTPSGAGAMWTTEEKRTPGYSVKLMGAGSASWTDENAVRNWLSGVPGYLNPEIVVGGWVKAVGVNTNPTTVDQKFQLVYQFFGADGTDLLGEPVVIDVPQGAANSDGWVEISSASLGAIALPSSGAAKRVKITFRKGANATGSVFLDDIFIRKANPAAEGWAGDWFNANFDVPQGWYYWMPGSATAGFSEGGADFTTTWKFRLTATTEDKATGARSLVIQDQLSEPSTEAPLISERVPVVAGQPVLVSFRAKHSGVTDPEALGTGDVNYGLTALFYNNMTGGADGYGEIGGADIRLNGDYNPMVIPLVSRVATSGWTHYSFIVYPKEGAIGMELRMRYWHSLTGSLFLDDIAIVSVNAIPGLVTGIDDLDDDGSDRAQGFTLHQNYPNPFNPSTMFRFELNQTENVTLEVFNTLGQRVAVLVDGAQLSSGSHRVAFDASGLSSGIYLYRLTKTDGQSVVRTMSLIK